jgi:hypothetical protein
MCALAVLAASLVPWGCNGSVPSVSGVPSSSPSATPPSPRGRSYLLIGKGGIDKLRAEAAKNGPAYQRLKENVDAHLDKVDVWGSSAENMALVHLLSGEEKYARAALTWARASMKDKIEAESYLEFGNLMRRVALTLDWCRPQLSKAERDELVSYLDASTHELWFANKGSGWGLEDPGNNYHMAFLEGTAFAAHALRSVGHPNADKYLALLTRKIEGDGGVLDYLEARGAGGDWHEGTNYGQVAKQRLYSALSVIAAAGGPNYFVQNPFFADSIRFAIYQLQPDRRSLHPAGDLARDTAMQVSPYDRDYVQTAARYLEDPAVKGLARWYLDHVMPSFRDKTFDWRGGYYRDLVFQGQGNVTPPSKLPLFYLAKGNGWATVRSGWDQGATSLSIAGNAIVDQSHAHHDVGSFTLFKGGWQAVDAASYASSGLQWEAGAHNMVHVVGHQRFPARVGGLTSFGDDGRVAYAHIDAGGLFRRRTGDEPEALVSEYTRDIVFLKPDTLVVYDRIAPKDPATEYQLRVHFAEKPESLAGGRFRARHQRGAMTLAILSGGEGRVMADEDLAEGASRAFRVEVPARGPNGRFLSALKVASGAPPALDAVAIASSDPVEGVLIDGWVVVFGKQGGGKLPPSFGYTLRGTPKRGHLLVRPPGGVDVRVASRGGETTVEVKPGSRAPDARGLVVIAP